MGPDPRLNIKMDVASPLPPTIQKWSQNGPFRNTAVLSPWHHLEPGPDVKRTHKQTVKSQSDKKSCNLTTLHRIVISIKMQSTVTNVQSNVQDDGSQIVPRNWPTIIWLDEFDYQ